MNDELRAAAERLRRFQAGESYEAIYGQGAFFHDYAKLFLDQKRLADAYLAEHTWSDTPPAEPGWYRWRDDPAAPVACVAVGRGAGEALFVIHNGQLFGTPSQFGGEWAGQISFPA